MYCIVLEWSQNYPHLPSSQFLLVFDRDICCRATVLQSFVGWWWIAMNLEAPLKRVTGDFAMIAKITVPFASRGILVWIIWIKLPFISNESHWFSGRLSNTIKLFVPLFLHWDVKLEMIREFIHHNDVCANLRKMFIKMHEKIDDLMILQWLEIFFCGITCAAITCANGQRIKLVP